MTREEAITILECAMPNSSIRCGASDEEIEEAMMMAIEALEQEPKTGYWIDDKCSICGKGIEDLIDSREWYKNETPNYCPFCGERVVERSEDI